MHESDIWSMLILTRSATSKLLRFVEARLTPGGEFGLHLTAGAALMACAVAVFAEVAENVAEQDGVAAFDQHVSDWMHGHAREPYTSFMWLLTHLHSVAGMGMLVALAGLYFWRKEARYWLLALVLAVPGGMLLNVALKHIYQRARPVFEEPMLSLPTYSFPSGHTVAATLFWGLLASYAVMGAQRWRTRAALVCASVLMVALAATSRIYLGAHYPSDVLAAMAEGCGWLAVCITACSTLRRRRLAQAGRLG
ncbi:phosphatase PAP2 family protein [Pseudoduganella sp. LjRoot289]|uniref:phosphatase PAP2 family protein n=1 Tax=Pseudoduganella sp. LjRoot289 TaxID=3342314 RepID=UPI003ECC6A64